MVVDLLSPLWVSCSFWTLPSLSVSSYHRFNLGRPIIPYILPPGVRLTASPVGSIGLRKVGHSSQWPFVFSDLCVQPVRPFHTTRLALESRPGHVARACDTLPHSNGIQVSEPEGISGVIQSNFIILQMRKLTLRG